MKKGKARKTTAFLGIDPGKNGAAFLYSSAGNHHYIDWSDDVQLIIGTVMQWKEDFKIEYAVLEIPSAIPGQNIKATASQFENVGQWRMLLQVLQIPYAGLSPTQWMKGLIPKMKRTNVSDSADKKARKTLNYKKAMELYPTESEIFSGPKGGIKDGRADAALMAEKARRVYLGIEVK